MKLYDKIKQLLTDYPEYRNSDKKLMWKMWQEETLSFGFDRGNYESISKRDFMYATPPETIRRTRQQIVAKYPELQSDKKILLEKKKIEAQRGTHVFREEVKVNLANLDPFDYQPTLF